MADPDDSVWKWSDELNEAVQEPYKEQADTIESALGRFGYDMTNPIPVRGAVGELEYLAHLHCECGRPFLFHRMGSCGEGPDGDVVDLYELLCGTGKHRIEPGGQSWARDKIGPHLRDMELCLQ